MRLVFFWARQGLYGPYYIGFSVGSRSPKRRPGILGASASFGLTILVLVVGRRSKKEPGHFGCVTASVGLTVLGLM